MSAEEIKRAIEILEPALWGEAHPRHFIGEAIAEFGGSYSGYRNGSGQLWLLGIRCSCTAGPGNLVRAWIAKARAKLVGGAA